jgi:carbonic anhydrase
MPHFAGGVVKFQTDIFKQEKELFEELSKGQNPDALFITCSDSRIETAMITQSKPGELFIVRNAGNIVPPHTNQTGGTTASIEFAVAALGVPHIVICGHTECGAMKGAISDRAKLDKLPHVREWLGFSQAAVDIVEAIGEGKSDEEKMTMLLQQNVILQLQHLCTHPTVAVKLARKELRLHGWVYDIKTGHVDAYDQETGEFIPVDRLYADAFKRHYHTEDGCCS